MKKILQSMVGLLAVGALLLPVSALAAEFIHPAEENGNVVLSTTETHKNLYVAGGNVTVNSTTQGDLYVAGGSITVDGPVEQDGVVAGGTVIVNNKVSGDLRVAGGNVTVNAEVTGDLLVAGGTVVVSEKAKVGGDVIAAGGTLTVAAPVSGKLWACGGMVTIDSAIAGPVVVRGSDSVTFGSKAVVGGPVRVHAQKEPVVKDGAQVPAIDFQKSQGFNKGQVVKGVVLGLVVSLLATLLVALVFAWIMPRRLEGFAAQLKARFWVNAGIGLAALVVTPIVVVILFIAFVGYQLAFILLLGYIFALVISWVLGVLWVGSWVYQLATKSGTLVVNWKTAIVGALVFCLIRFIPVLGGLFCFVVMLAAFGQLLTSTKHTFLERGGVKE